MSNIHLLIFQSLSTNTGASGGVDSVSLKDQQQFYHRSHVTYVDHPCGVALLEVKQHRGLVEVRHHHHVLDLVKLWGVHGKHLILPDCQSLGNRGGNGRQIQVRPISKARGHRIFTTISTHSVVQGFDGHFAVRPVLDLGLDIQLFVVTDKACRLAVKRTSLSLRPLPLRLPEELGSLPEDRHFPICAHFLS